MSWVTVLMYVSQAATTQPSYYAHPAREDAHGVIAPWYTGLNGQLDFRLRVSAETLKRYPWVDEGKAVMMAPHYVFTSMWSIDAEGNIGAPPLEDWACGDLGQRTVSVINAMADYYRYSGDPAAIGIMKMQADYIVGYALTPADHPWPRFPISCPTKGKPYGQCDPKGFIQLDLSADIGTSIVRAYMITGDTRYLDAAKHWGDLLAERCDATPGATPWPRYANPESSQWSNLSAGSTYMITCFLETLIRLGHTGKDDALIRARNAGRAHFETTLFPKWASAADTWGRYYWDWEDPVYSLVGAWAMKYVLDFKEAFPGWKTDARNVLTLIFNRTGVDPASAAETYSGAWAVPESPSCCGLSLSYGQQLTAASLAQYAALAGDPWARELARRMAIQGSYDVLENGTVVDGIAGTPIVAGNWLNIIHPLAMRQMLNTIAWMPDLFAPNRENHIVRSTTEIVSVHYAKGSVDYSAYDAPGQTVTALRLAFAPARVMADDASLEKRADLDAPGYTVAPLSNGDTIVLIRHDGAKHVRVEGDDPQEVARSSALAFSGAWTEAHAETGERVSDVSTASVAYRFTGNQIRVVGSAGPRGGCADVFVDGVKDRAGFDCWSPVAKAGQILFSKSGLTDGPHEIKVVVLGEKNPLAEGCRVAISELQYSAATGNAGFGSGEGPAGPQRMVFGYPGQADIKDARGNPWRPATEWILRMGPNGDSVAAAWWTSPAEEKIENTDTPDLYRYGVHAPEFIVNLTVAPGAYDVTLKFAATRGYDTGRNRVTVLANGKPVVEKLDVAAAAGGPNRAHDVPLEGLTPKNGIIELRFVGGDKDAGVPGEAFVQALELTPRK